MLNKISKFKKNCLFGLSLFLLFFLFLLISTNHCFAQSISLSITPPLTEIIIKPGKSVTQVFEIGNNSDQDLYLRAQVIPFEPADLEGNIFIDQKSPSSHLSDFFSLANSNLNLNQIFKLSAGSKKKLPLKISIPENETEQDHYFTFLVEQTPEGVFFTTGTGAQSFAKIGANILLTITSSGQTKKEGLTKIVAKPKIADIFDSVFFDILTENNGSNFFKTYGKIEISNRVTKKIIKIIPLKPDNVLAYSARRINCFSIENLKENQKINSSNTCFFRSFLPGAYQATVVIFPDNQEPKIVAKTAFFLVPGKLTIALIVLTAIVLSVIRLSFKKFHNALDNH